MQLPNRVFVEVLGRQYIRLKNTKSLLSQALPDLPGELNPVHVSILFNRSWLIRNKFYFFRVSEHESEAKFAT